MRRTILLFLSLTLVVLSLILCQKGNLREPLQQPDTGIRLPAPADLNDGWKVGSLSEVGMNPKPVQEMIDEIESWPEHHFEGILIIRDGKLVFEKYYPGLDFNWNNPALPGIPKEYTAQTRHYLASGSKSVTSLLFGIAVDQGLIPDLDIPITNFYDSEYSGLLQGQKRHITVRHLLCMMSGLSWDEETPATNDCYTLFRTADPIRFILDLPMQYAPGTRFHYNSGSTNILGDLIHNTSGMPLTEFAERYLFTPLGITDWEWKPIRNDEFFASGGLYLRPRDMARLGQLFLNHGSWKGQQLVSGRWIKESSISRCVPDHAGLGKGYGYQWWLNDFRSRNKSYPVVFSAGWGEQMMYIFPEYNIILLFFGSYYFHGPYPTVRMLVEQYLLRSFPCLDSPT